MLPKQYIKTFVCNVRKCLNGIDKRVKGIYNSTCENTNFLRSTYGNDGAVWKRKNMEGSFKAGAAGYAGAAYSGAL